MVFIVLQQVYLVAWLPRWVCLVCLGIEVSVWVCLVCLVLNRSSLGLFGFGFVWFRPQTNRTNVCLFYGVCSTTTLQGSGTNTIQLVDAKIRFEL